MTLEDIHHETGYCGLVELELPATFDKVYEQEAYDNEVNPNRGCRNLRDRRTVPGGRMN